MRRPKGTGGIRKLSGNRKKPYQAVMPSGYHVVNDCIVPKQVSIGTFRTRREAADALAEYCVKGIKADGRKVTFADVYEKIKSDFPKSTVYSMQAAFKHCKPLHNRRVVDLSIDDYQVIMDNIIDMSNSAKNDVIQIFSMINRYCLERDYTIKDYSQFVKVHRKKEVAKQNIYTKAEIKAVHGSEDALQMILLYTGMRISEALSVDLAHLSEHGKRLYISVAESKTAAGIRYIPVHNKIADIVNDALKHNREYLIEPHVAYNAANKSYSEFNEKHGISHTFHDFRKTFATQLKICKVDDFYRKSLLGHKQEGVTNNVYTKATLDALFEAMDKIAYSV